MIRQLSGWRIAAVIIGTILAAALLFSGCKGSENDAQTAVPSAEIESAGPETDSSGSGSTDAAPETTAAVSASSQEEKPETTPGGEVTETETKTLTGLRFRYYGMQMYPVYAIRRVPEGYECTITGGPIYWPEMDGEEAMEYYELNEERGYGYEFYTGGDPLDPEGGMHSLAVIGEDEVQDLYEELLEEDILAWDGYDEVWEAPEEYEVTDTGETFYLDLVFSDGSHLNAHGIDAFPENYDTVVRIIIDFFEEHQDYSAYYPADFPDAEADTLMILFYDPNHFYNTPSFQIELHSSWDNEWIIRLTDPDGEFMPAGTDISEYGNLPEGETLPIEQFLDLLKKYDLGSWNQVTDSESGGPDEYWEITVYYENGQMYNVFTNQRPENYDAFREEAIRAICDYYAQVKGE